jgi:hypothetical protein
MIAAQSSVLGRTGYQPVAVGNLPAASCLVQRRVGAARRPCLFNPSMTNPVTFANRLRTTPPLPAAKGWSEGESAKAISINLWLNSLAIILRSPLRHNQHESSRITSNQPFSRKKFRGPNPSKSSKNIGKMAKNSREEHLKNPQKRSTFQTISSHHANRLLGEGESYSAGLKRRLKFRVFLIFRDLNLVAKISVYQCNPWLITPRHIFLFKYPRLTFNSSS